MADDRPTPGSAGLGPPPPYTETPERTLDPQQSFPFILEQVARASQGVVRLEAGASALSREVTTLGDEVRALRTGIAADSRELRDALASKLGLGAFITGVVAILGMLIALAALGWTMGTAVLDAKFEALRATIPMPPGAARPVTPSPMPVPSPAPTISSLPPPTTPPAARRR